MYFILKSRIQWKCSISYSPLYRVNWSPSYNLSYRGTVKHLAAHFKGKTVHHPKVYHTGELLSISLPILRGKLFTILKSIIQGNCPPSYSLSYRGTVYHPTVYHTGELFTVLQPIILGKIDQQLQPAPYHTGELLNIRII